MPPRTHQLLPQQQTLQPDAFSVGKLPAVDERRWLQMEAELAKIQQENMSLHRQVAELHAKVLQEQERADAAAEAAATAASTAAATAAPSRLNYGSERPRSQERDMVEPGSAQRTSEAVKQQLLDSRAELAAVASKAGGSSRAETLLMSELEQQRNVAVSLRRELQKVVAAAARDKEALSQEVRAVCELVPSVVVPVRHWQLAANQAATVAERAQQKADQVRRQARELGSLQQQLAAVRTSLEQRTAQLEKLDAALLQPLLAWHMETDPAVGPALVAGMGVVTRGSRGGSPGGGRTGAGLARGGNGGNTLGKGQQVAVGGGATHGDADAATDHQIRAVVSAFEVLRAAAQQARCIREQLQAALDAKAELREALAAERASSEVQELAAELNHVRLESAQTLKAAADEAEQRAAAAFEHGRQAGDRQAAVAVAALHGELAEHERALQREGELRELAVAEARRAGELAIAQVRKDAEAAAAQARLEAAAAAAAQTRRECEAAAEEARREGEAALQQARREWERALDEARRHAEAAEEAVRREAAEARGEREAELQRIADEAQRHAGLLEEQLQRTEERAAEALTKCEQYLAQVYELTQELQQVRQDLADKDAQAEAAAKEHDAATAELEARLCECIQRLSAQAEQQEEYIHNRDEERTRSLDTLRSSLAHVCEERDGLQSECVVLRSQLSAIQAAAAGVEMEMEALSSALEAQKAARSAAEAAADEARRSAAAATTAAEESVARVAVLAQQLQEVTLTHEREMHLLEARYAAELDSAQARFHTELEALHTRLKMLRLKQSRVMAYVDDVFMPDEEQQQQQQQQAQQQEAQQGFVQGQRQQHQLQLLQHEQPFEQHYWQYLQQEQQQLMHDRDQTPRWSREMQGERRTEEALLAGAGVSGRASWGQQDGLWGWQQQSAMGTTAGDGVPTDDVSREGAEEE
ncbi:hypothetical protein VOLCADRAFT_121687 [Volvox carteri f. nagariensis]|uniref:Uncharacterized protein n=1 Tax=Volvox carteri f. nagariensis TaxID=3068 RepID=D8UHM4_VOLCA|nr:uncharacterized protein VOLCADRAFT_121687 [Volvox carteri f. nagariensis]EFJ40797.1 hypothetical protein VOLCADRAFT_121687 [Volvox carteri f. nagariensis]|eukprot:XP_002958172.1 hypothetical protein VOLCADRAFT_121687 [Volvox carteri f. nagariensis]